MNIIPVSLQLICQGFGKAGAIANTRKNMIEYANPTKEDLGQLTGLNPEACCSQTTTVSPCLTNIRISGKLIHIG